MPMILVKSFSLFLMMYREKKIHDRIQHSSLPKFSN
ncbi:rCG29806 [Rattus norvegicus]|uniref:RCG29806 n=1 Tax=Rattus norvegicus TaxID=10116 RepID=A6IMM9_RAT|nr:rCG29806 [Rattus norvegicus]